MANHTPGPWIFDKTNVGHTAHAGYALYAPDFETGHEFCYVLCSGEKERVLGIGVPEANARLIAAAPELLASLREILSLAKEWGKNPDYYSQAEANIVGFAESAIAKAEGQ